MQLKNRIRCEDTEQERVIGWANANIDIYPELKYLFHIPNGGKRNRMEGAKLKMMGVKAGVADLCLPYRKGKYIGLFIELKYDNGKVSKEQKEFLKEMARAGHLAAVCYGADAAINVIEQYCGYDVTRLLDFTTFEVKEDAGVITVK